MKKEPLSFADVEQLLTELAQQDLHAAAQDVAQTELMRGAARGEIRRVFFRRRCLRAAGSMALLAGLGSSLFLLLPDQENTLAGNTAPAPAVSPIAPVTSLRKVAKRKAGPTAAAPVPSNEPFECSPEVCEVVIYSVPL